MKKFALITSLLLGAAPLAQAQTWYGGDYDRRVDEGQAERQDADRHVDEGLRESFRPNRAPSVRLVTMEVMGKQTVDFPRNTGRFQTLRLRALRGVGYIDFVEVRYGNGEQQHVDVRHVIGGDEDVDINVHGRRVEAITVHGGPNPRDRYSRRARIEVVGMR